MFTVIIALFVGFIEIAAVGGMFILPVVLIAMFVVRMRRYHNYEKLQPTPQKCSFCGSKNVEVKSMLTLTDKAILGDKAYQAGFQNKRALICKDCGHSIPYIDQYDINAEKDGTKTEMKVIAVLIVISVFGLWGFMSGVQLLGSSL